MTLKTKQSIAVVLNVLTIIFEIVAFIIRPDRYGIPAIAFYTILSNIIAFISSALFLVKHISKKQTPFVRELRFCACITLVITFFVVVLILVWFTDPMELLFAKNNKYHHIIIPIMTCFSYLYCEEHIDSKNALWLPMGYSILYCIIMIILNSTGVVDGPYPFFMVKRFGFPIVMLSCTGIGIVTYLISLLLYKYGSRLEGKYHEQNL